MLWVIGFNKPIYDTNAHAFYHMQAIWTDNPKLSLNYVFYKLSADLICFLHAIYPSLKPSIMAPMIHADFMHLFMFLFFNI